MATVFKEIFDQCKEDNKKFKVNNLKGIVLDTERNELELAIGKETVEKLMIWCLVHYGRSYQHVDERVSASLPRDIHKISKDTFCTIA